MKMTEFNERYQLFITVTAVQKASLMQLDDELDIYPQDIDDITDVQFYVIQDRETGEEITRFEAANELTAINHLKTHFGIIIENDEELLI